MISLWNTRSLGKLFVYITAVANIFVSGDTNVNRALDNCFLFLLSKFWKSRFPKELFACHGPTSKNKLFPFCIFEISETLGAIIETKMELIQVIELPFYAKVNTALDYFSFCCFRHFENQGSPKCCLHVMGLQATKNNFCCIFCL